MSKRLTSRDDENRLLFNGRRVIAGEHAPAYLELEDAEDRIAKLEAQCNKYKNSKAPELLALVRDACDRFCRDMVVARFCPAALSKPYHKETEFLFRELRARLAEIEGGTTE